MRLRVGEGVRLMNKEALSRWDNEETGPWRMQDGNELEVAAKMLEESWPVIFNGNGYGAEWPPEAEKRGLHIQNSNPEAIQVSSKQ